MNVLMIYPQYPPTFWSFKHILKFISKKAAYPPLSLLTVAAMLPEHWDVRLKDLNVSSLYDSEIASADYVMISGMLVQKNSAQNILKRCRRLGKKVIAGGPLFRSESDGLSEMVDHLILGEAEEVLPEFLRDLENGSPKKVYRAKRFPDLSLTPVPRWDLVEAGDYATLTLQSSRGCPFDCDFCDITTLYGRKSRVKSTPQIIAELDAIYELGWRGSVFFVDDNFIGNKGKIKRMLPVITRWMEERDHPFEFMTEASIDISDDDELIEMMVAAGFDTVFVGLETPNEKSLEECSKRQNIKRDLIAAIKKLQAAGLQVFGGYIIGFDNDDEGIFSRQIRFIQESGVVTAMVGLLNALPNTRLYERLKSENRLMDDPSGDNTDGSINFIPKMDQDQLLEGYRRVVHTLYSPKHLKKRLFRFLGTYRPARRKRLNLHRLKGFVKSIYHLGILGKGGCRLSYWDTVIRTFIFHRRSFPEAITLMVYGYHFKKVADRI